MMIGFIEMRKIKLHLLLKLKEPQVEDSEDEGKKEADSSLNKHYEKIESAVNNEGRLGEEIDDDFAPLDEQGWLMYSGGQENAEKFEGEVRRRQLTSFVNNELVDYLKTLEGQNVLQSNRLSIHTESGEILLDDRETDENFYEFLELQMNENKRLITTALRFSGSLKAFFENYLTADIGTKEQWELDTRAFICLKFLVANYNSGYLIFNGKDPVYCKYTRAAEDDDMFETMNEINWHEFLNSSIEGALQGAAGNDNQWIKNIFKNLDSCFKEYREIFEDIVQACFKLLVSGPEKNIIRVLSFLDIPAKNLRDTIDILGYENLFFKCADKFFQTGRTSLNNSGRTLSKINPLDHLDCATSLPAFYPLFKIYRKTETGWMLAAFFIGQFFQEIAEEFPQSKMLIVNMLVELL